MGMERLVLLLQQEDDQLEAWAPDLFIVALGEKAQKAAFPLCHALRSHGASVRMDYENRSLKSQMKQSGKCNCRFTLIIGDDEIDRGFGTLRNMQTSDQEEIALPGDVSSWIENICSKL